MSQIVVVARIRALPADIDSVARAIETLAQATRLEDGCLYYDVFASVAQGGEVLIHECWRDRDALSAHGQTEHMAAFKATVAGKAEISVQKLTEI